MTKVRNAEFVRRLYDHRAAGHDTVMALDFETNCSVKLPETGLGPYFEDPDYQTLMVGIAFIDNAYQVWSTVYELDELGIGLELVYEQRKHGPLYAHNSAFEMEVLRREGYNVQVRDTAVLARIHGANSHLEWAGPQLTGINKMTSGKAFIKKFCLGDPKRVTAIWIEDNKLQNEWLDGKEYCANDAEVCLAIAMECDNLSDQEWGRFFLTQQMNVTGWKVDTDLLKAMSVRYQNNRVNVLARWHAIHQPVNASGKPLNLNSPVQVREYLSDRGLVVGSTDKTALIKVQKRLLNRTTRSVEDQQVLALINAKQEIGGSSLTKLDTIRSQLCADGRLRHQYSHCGAGQTWRTSGRGVQMQNLKRLGPNAADMDDGVDAMSNTEMADNLRQLFVASERGRLLMVSDLASIEARVLAWLAGDSNKLDQFANGVDVYKELAAVIYEVRYANVSKDQRSHGKVGELAGGYGMGAVALKDYAEKMRIDLELDQCKAIITAYRQRNSLIVELWARLNAAMVRAIGRSDDSHVEVGPSGLDYWVTFSAMPEKGTINSVMAGTQVLTMSLCRGPEVLFSRVWRGVYLTQGNFGDELVYHKSPMAPNHNKLWVDHTVDPDTGARWPNKIWGGKVTGVLVQSFAREMFFDMMIGIEKGLAVLPTRKSVLTIGQFHDELVLDVAVEDQLMVRDLVTAWMSASPFDQLPVGCEVNAHYRYIK